MLRKVVYILLLISFIAIVVYKPNATSEPAANPLDPAKEDLSRVDYPSQA